MQSRQDGNRSSLFLVRLWRQANEEAQPNWGGRVVHITSGKACGFLHLSALTALLVEMLGPDAADAQKSIARDEASAVATPNGGLE